MNKEGLPAPHRRRSRHKMKILLTSKQIPEIADLPWRDRYAILRRHHWKAFSNWRGLLAIFFLALGIFGGITLPRIIFPNSSSFVGFVAAFSIYIPCLIAYISFYHHSLIPHIREEMSFRMEKNLI